MSPTSDASDRPIEGVIEVRYADWLVGDGDEAVVVGERWSPTLLLECPRPTETTWIPALRPSTDPSPSRLRPVDGVPAEHEVLGDVLGTWDEESAVPALAVRAGPWTLAAPGHHVGRLQGRAVVVHDTYEICDEQLRALVTPVCEVIEIVYLAARTRRAGWRTRVQVGWDPPRSVPDTHALGADVLGTFVVTCRRLP